MERIEGFLDCDKYAEYDDNYPSKELSGEFYIILLFMSHMMWNILSNSIKTMSNFFVILGNLFIMLLNNKAL